MNGTLNVMTSFISENDLPAFNGEKGHILINYSNKYGSMLLFFLCCKFCLFQASSPAGYLKQTRKETS